MASRRFTPSLLASFERSDSRRRSGPRTRWQPRRLDDEAAGPGVPADGRARSSRARTSIAQGAQAPAPLVNNTRTAGGKLSRRCDTLQLVFRKSLSRLNFLIFRTCADALIVTTMRHLVRPCGACHLTLFPEILKKIKVLAALWGDWHRSCTPPDRVETPDRTKANPYNGGACICSHPKRKAAHVEIYVL